MKKRCKDELECLFTDIESAGYGLLIFSYGLRSDRLSDLPEAGKTAAADVMEHAHRAMLNDSFRREDETINNDNISEFSSKDSKGKPGA